LKVCQGTTAPARQYAVHHRRIRHENSGTYCCMWRKMYDCYRPRPTLALSARELALRHSDWSCKGRENPACIGERNFGSQASFSMSVHRQGELSCDPDLPSRPSSSPAPWCDGDRMCAVKHRRTASRGIGYRGQGEASPQGKDSHATGHYYRHEPEHAGRTSQFLQGAGQSTVESRLKVPAVARVPLLVCNLPSRFAIY
jgi:hypothetical protein